MRYVSCCVVFAAWASLSGLKVLDASHNLLSGSLPHQLPSQLEELHIEHNALQGMLPNYLVFHPHLRCLSLYNNPGLCGNVHSGIPCINRAGTNLSAAPATISCINAQTDMHLKSS